MESGSIQRGISQILDCTSDSRNSSVYLINPGRKTFEALVESLTPESKRQIMIVAREPLLKDMLDEFILASRTADLEADEVISLRANSTFNGNALFASTERIVAVLETPSEILGIPADESGIVSTMRGYCEHQWNRASDFNHRTPPRRVIRESLAEEIGKETQRDFDTMLEVLGTARGDAGEMNEVAVSLLAAARNGVQLYDISKWGEDTGVASKATFSRAKTRLEEVGLIDTHKIPIQLGRPRLKLVLGEDEFNSMTIDELASVAIARLET